MTSEPPPPLDVEALRTALTPEQGWYRRIDVQPVTGSTNADAADAARAGAPEGTVVTAEHQTHGRGRLDRTFSIPARSGIAVSVVLRPDAVPAGRWVWLPLLAGLALDDTLRDLGVDGRLKWPNDVLVDGRKISGILLERVETPQGPAAVVGIGLNVLLTPDQLPVPTATSLAIAGATDLDRTAITISLLRHLARHYRAWVAAAGVADPGLRGDYVARCDTVGRQVDVAMPDGSVLSGTVGTVDGSGRLVVDGTAVSAGDVTHVRPRRTEP
ncbi:biotin--[acetyl-CoA-carboxylase] ligase [Aeromicrobium marinum DSM 15272]|uniref:Biotin--[acetyl-CoA-carboxylase] ligase n=1 Tax=Aeromicrobium marinum DSM 15272 TaxID=585531 RepID=E2SBM7_9ACTN|nr:biotin--[acetyl-CoA-carboxylase] ligase [Aeromicrobium marinum]EFQ83773.1 biotin--[acetyl-CoA-carboxylase] ligase [Aeromicrobium marinum DSM 15272]